MAKTAEDIEAERAAAAKDSVTLDLRKTELEIKKVEVLKIQADTALKATTGAAASTDAPASGTMIQLSEVLDQLSKVSCPMLSLAELSKAQAVYEQRMEGKCPKDEAPTDIQISATMFCLRQSWNVFADFAIYGPHQHRMMRKLLLSGLVPAGDGTYRRIELKGPPDFHIWKKAFKVYRNNMIMIEAVGVNQLDRYLQIMSKFYSDYGACVWLLLYQADVRMRYEEMPTIRRELAEEAEKIKKAGGEHPYDEANPWRLVWKRAVGDECRNFWQDEFVTPAQHVRLRLKTIGEVVDGDAPVETPKEAAAPRFEPVREVISPRRSPPPRRQAPTLRPKRGAEAVDGEYKYDRNNRRKRLCLCSLLLLMP